MSPDHHDDAKIAEAALGGESVGSFMCDTCGWVDEFEFSDGLPCSCPRCGEPGSLNFQNHR